MDLFKLLLLPVISAFIGWFTNWIAIKMLFHPKEPKRILGITIQGIFPKRQQQFATKLGMTVANELLHFSEITEQIKDPAALAPLMPSIESHIDVFLKERLEQKIPMISMFVGEAMLLKIKQGLMEEIEAMLPEVIGQFADNLEQKIDIQKLVTDKVSRFSSDKIENLLVGIMSKEFKFVEIIGGVLGFLIGMLQVVLTLL